MKEATIRDVSRRITRRIVDLFILLLNQIVPKDDNLFVFMSVPDYADNTQTLFAYVSAKLPSKKLIWLVQNEANVVNLLKKGYNARSYKSLLGVWNFLRACCIITSHNQLVNFKSKKQLYVALWHGMPLKKIGIMEAGTDARIIRRILNKIDLLTATSDTTASLLGASFHLDSSKIIVTGQPRCDALFNPLGKDVLSAVLKKKKDSKLVLFMPTFRQGYLQRTEGRIFNFHNVFGFEGFDDENFKDFLIRNDIIFLCKLHPFEEKLFMGKFSGDDNRVLFVSNNTLAENEIDLYRLIGTVDLLITDYSSVYFDYLLLNKPMVFTPTDLEEYEKKRGFLLEPYDFWTPGPKATNQEQLQDEIVKSLKDTNYYRKERETINNIINHYKDNRSCERVTRVTMEKLNRKKRRTLIDFV